MIWPYPMIESCVVRFWIRDDELACPLVTSIYADASICQSLWTQKCHQLEEKVGLSFEQVWGFFPNGIFEQLRVVPWHTIPGLCLSPMH